MHWYFVRTGIYLSENPEVIESGVSSAMVHFGLLSNQSSSTLFIDIVDVV